MQKNGKCEVKIARKVSTGMVELILVKHITRKCIEQQPHYWISVIGSDG